MTDNVDSTLLQMEDLGTLFGIVPAARKAAAGEPVKSTGRVLPAAPFDPERWDAMDADVHFTGKRVVRVIELPINDVDTRVVMEDGHLWRT